MQVFVTGRQGGKTHASIKWLLDGFEIPRYPFWSRVLVVHDVQSVLFLQKRLTDQLALRRDLVESHNWVRKAIWGPNDVLSSGGVLREVEVGIDNVELFLANLIHRVPSFVTMTGELYVSEPHDAPHTPA